MQEVQRLGAAVASSEMGLHPRDSGQGLGESAVEEPLRGNCDDSSVLLLHTPEVKESRAAMGSVVPESALHPFRFRLV